MTAVIVTYLLWLVYSILEGTREAKYFSYKMRASIKQQKSFIKDEHVLFTVQRAIVAAIALLSFGQISVAMLMLASFALSFPFFHDGAYYAERNKLDGIYANRWFDQSNSSTALMDRLKLLSPISRTAMFGVSVLILVYVLMIIK